MWYEDRTLYLMEIFRLGPYVFHVDMARRLARGRPPDTTVEVASHVALIVDGSVPIDYTKEVDLERPVICAHTPEGLVLVDPWEAIWRAHLAGVPFLGAITLTPDESRAVRRG